MRGVAGSRQSGGRVFMGRDGAVGEFVGAALRWWRGEGVPVRGGVGNYCRDCVGSDYRDHPPPPPEAFRGKMSHF